tara:strand:+ start:561 stop:2663 length:2103 start_codon:yes stop_codon:yes gene_type:complete
MSINDFEENEPQIIELDTEALPGLIGYVHDKFQEAETGRLPDESRWLLAYKNYRGITDGSTTYASTEKSKVFLKITKVKVLAAFGQISDILFANNRFPLTVSPTDIPFGIAEFAHIPTMEEDAFLKNMPDQMLNTPLSQLNTTGQPDKEFLAGLKEKYSASSLVEGPAILGTPQIDLAMEAARNMEKTIHDQLTDTNAMNVLRHAIFECCLLGTGIVKGPFNYNKTIPNWKIENEQKVFSPTERIVPRIEAVSCWDFYPDPTAVSTEDAEYIIQRHRFNRQQLRNLKNRPFFSEDTINNCLATGPNYDEKYYENVIHAEDTESEYSEQRYEVLEYWGTVDAAFAREVGLPVPENVGHMDSVQINIWVCGTEIIRCVLNPFIPARLPYHAFPYEINPYQLLGIGVGENMQDSQLLINGHMRMAIDNLALAGNLVFDVDETQLVPGQNMEVFPGKIFRRQSGQSGAAINGIKFPNTSPDNLQMYQTARQLADEQTGIPSIVHGQTGVTGTGRTAAGLSMIMGSAGLSIKTVIKNIDDSLLKPLGEAFFQWNMQFNDNEAEIRGDLEIKPKGIASVMQKEVRTQRLTTLLQTVANPMLAPFIKIPNLVKELAISQDIDPEQLVNDANEAAVFADILKGLMNESPNGQNTPPSSQQPPDMGADGEVPVGANPMDQSGVGGGNIGVGSAPVAGEDGFTGNPPQPS